MSNPQVPLLLIQIALIGYPAKFNPEDVALFAELERRKKAD